MRGCRGSILARILTGTGQQRIKNNKTKDIIIPPGIDTTIIEILLVEQMT
jgi:hypothetical protein